MIRIVFHLLLAVLLQTGLAAAQDCMAQTTDFDFGAVSLRAGAVNQTAGNVKITCRGGIISAVARPVGVCLTFGGGNASDGGTPPRRYMVGPSGALLEYQLRQTSGGAPLSQMFVEVLMLLGNGSATVPIYADIIAQSVQMPTGSYSATYSGSGASGVRMRTGVLTCNILAQDQAADGFQVRAQAASSCDVSTTALDFGNIPAQLNGPVDKTASIEVRCTDGTPYRVSLGLGQGPGVNNPAARKMRNLLSTLTYGLYQDAARTQPWGDQLGSNVSGLGAGAAQIYTVYGRIFGNQTPNIGIYTDNIVVTIAY
ncbi:spore coat protein U [Cypionkella aquatica]|uniref:Spore coat protein U n=1 Tax=Cypionkella aquatica TaxID=1756042 RepID=A0AA37X0V0_9RHOB|nr:spore coat U domain-containing protein [Cypionkella aquatica]GLS86150.1 spore coat protein U [Cypionkella aquatica]